MKKLLLLLCLVLMPGCSVFNFGSKTSAVKTPPQVKRAIKKLHEDLPPEKTPGHSETERIALELAKIKVDTAKNISEDEAVKSELRTANEILSSLQRSLGVPVEEVQATIENIRKTIENLDKDNKAFKHENYVYRQHMKENQKTIAALRGIINTKIQKEASLLGSVKRWFWIAVVLSVLIVVFVPGGMFLVKRAWSKTASLAVSGVGSAINAMGDLSTRLGKYMETLDKDEREKLKDQLSKMHPDNVSFWDKVKGGNNPLKEAIHHFPSKVLKVLDQ